VGPLLFVNYLPNWELTFEHERELQTVIAARAIEEIARERDLQGCWPATSTPPLTQRAYVSGAGASLLGV
jgi:hypothetical protein